MCIMAFHLFFNLEVLICECFADLLGLQCQHRLEGLFFAAEYLDFPLVIVELLAQLLDHFLNNERSVTVISS